MGNRQPGHTYSFHERFDVLETGPVKSGHYKLHSRENGQQYIGRQLTCNDQNESFQLECIINEKYNNPSPFVTKLIKHENGYEQSYCSTDHKFYLLYRQIPKLLFDEINQRSVYGQPFLIQQVDAVLNRVAKGLMYLYDINHHHGAVNTRSITWPTNPKQSIQLIDEWALRSNNKQLKQRVFRPKDQEDIDEKMLLKSNDLYSLGIVGREMINVANGQNFLAHQQGFSQLSTKIQILLSPQPLDRFLVYNLLNTHMPQNQIIQQTRGSQKIMSMKVMNSSPIVYQNAKNPLYENIQTNYTLLNPPQIVNNVKVNTQEVRANPLHTSVSGNFIYPRPQSQPASNKIITTNYVPHYNPPLNTVSALPSKNITTSKNNLLTISKNNNNFNRNASTGKINFTFPAPNLIHSSSNSKINPSVIPLSSSLRRSMIIPTLQQNQPIIQFTQSSQQQLKKSIINYQTTQVHTQQNLSASRNKPIVNFNSSLKNSFIEPPNSNISNVNTSNIPNTQPTQSLKVSQSSITNNNITNNNINNNNINNTQYNPINSINNPIPTISVNLISNLNSIQNISNSGGLSYSFGNSDQTFSFKGLQGSSGQQVLFTSPEFYAKVRESSNLRQSQTISNKQIIKPSINTTSTKQFDYFSTTTSNPVYKSQDPLTKLSKKQVQKPRVQENNKNQKQIYKYGNYMQIDKYLQNLEQQPVSKASTQKQIQQLEKSKYKQWNNLSTYNSYQSKANSYQSKVYSWKDPYTSSYTNTNNYTFKQKQYERQKQKQKNQYFSNNFVVKNKNKRNMDQTSAEFYQQIAIGRSQNNNKYDAYTPIVSTTYNYNKYMDYSSKYDDILNKLPSIPSYHKSNHLLSEIDFKQKKINKNDNYSSTSKDKDKFNDKDNQLQKNDYSSKYDYNVNIVNQKLKKQSIQGKNKEIKIQTIQIIKPKSPKKQQKPTIQKQKQKQKQTQTKYRIPSGSTLLPIKQHKITTSLIQNQDIQQQQQINTELNQNKISNNNNNININVQNIMKVSGNSNLSLGNRNSHISHGNSKDSISNISNISNINKNSNISSGSKNSHISNNNSKTISTVPNDNPININPTNTPTNININNSNTNINTKHENQIIQQDNDENINNTQNIKNNINNIDNFSHINQNKSYSISPQSVKNVSANSSPDSNKVIISNIHEPIQQIQEQQDKVSPQYTPNLFQKQDIKLIIQNNQNNIYQKAENAKNNINANRKSPTSPPEQLQSQPNNRKNVENLRTTPGKNTNSNQPFSAIPEVSERSMSLRSQQERDYVIEQYQNGSRYEGYKSHGMRNGKGKFYYQEGSFYDGEWKNNNMHGYGKLYYSNNKLAYEGQWFIDQFHGRGRVFNDQPATINGFFDYTNFDNLDEKWKYYEGDLVCDSKEGQGKLMLSNEQFYQGQFKNDKVQGKGRFYTKNGQIINGVWEDSKLIMKL